MKLQQRVSVGFYVEQMPIKHSCQSCRDVSPFCPSLNDQSQSKLCTYVHHFKTCFLSI